MFELIHCQCCVYSILMFCAYLETIYTNFAQAYSQKTSSLFWAMAANSVAG